MPDLKTLIVRCRDDSNESFRRMADRAAKAGHKIKYQSINELSIAPPKAWPKSPETIRALAVALGVTEKAVVLAYAESLGIDTRSPDGFAAMLPPHADEMDPEMRDALLRVIRVASRRTDEASQSWPEAGGAPEQPPPPMTQEELSEAAADAIAARDRRMGRAPSPRNDSATGRERRRGGGSALSGGDDTTTRGEGARGA